MSEGPAADFSAAVPAVASTPLFELLLTICHPPKRVRSASRKTKNAKAVSENRGPFEVSVQLGWTTFLHIVAEKLTVQPSDLVVASFEWHWVKPVSGLWLPVQDETGFMSMLKKIKSKAECGEPYVVIRMQVPIQRKAAGPSAWDVEDEESDFEDGSPAKKVRLLLSFVLSFTHFLAGEAR